MNSSGEDIEETPVFAVEKFIPLRYPRREEPFGSPSSIAEHAGSRSPAVEAQRLVEEEDFAFWKKGRASGHMTTPALRLSFLGKADPERSSGN